MRIDKVDDSARRWIAAQLRGEANTEPTNIDDVCGALEREGVAPLLYELWRISPPKQTSRLQWHEMAQKLAQVSAMRQLLRHSESRRIQTLFAANGIECIWLKGSALACWLYSNPNHRPCADLDLLFESHDDALRAADLLASIEYRLPMRHIAGDLYVHELLAVHAGHGLELDMHWRLANSALFSERLHWAELRTAAITVQALGEDALALAPVHAMLHACIHRACNQVSHRANRLLGLYDIHLIAQRLSEPEWTQFVDLAIDRRIAEPCLDALKACVAYLATRLPESVMRSLSDAARRESLRSARLRRWSYFQCATFCEFPTWQMRLCWLRQMLIGDTAHLRERYGADGAGIVRVLLRRLVDGLRRWSGYMRA